MRCRHCGRSFNGWRGLVLHSTKTHAIGARQLRSERPEDFAEHFWAGVSHRSPDECWPWLRATGGPIGHGMLRVGGELKYAHRIAYALVVGPIPDGLIVRHTCDNPPCCNPAHLLVGTQRDNIHDAWRRERTVPSEMHRWARLRERDVLEIRSAVAAGCKQADLAREFGVWPQTIASVVLGRTWSRTEGLLHKVLPRVGETHGAAKLREVDISRIRLAVKKGESQASVARRFSVSPLTIGDVVHRRSWKHIE